MLAFMFLPLLLAQPALANSPNTEHSMDLTAIPYSNTDGTTETLAVYKGKVILVVNTASRCGFTPQYAGLERLYRSKLSEGLVVVAFPSNDYGGQEPGSDLEILDFCKTRFDVTFPIKSKMSTKGADKSPLYAALTGEGSPFPGEVSWNFEKFLIDRNGKLVGRWKSRTAPDSEELVAAIDKALAQ
jgi:glutathione peroxidase